MTELIEVNDTNCVMRVSGLTEIAEIANTTCEQILPPQSKEKYNSVYLRFQTWRKTKNVPISENVMLTYFTELMETMLPSSLWAIFSMLKATIKIYDQSDIGAFSKLIAFLKRNSENYIPKKSSFLSDENIEKFLNEAPDDHYLVIKVKVTLFTKILIFAYLNSIVCVLIIRINYMFPVNIQDDLYKILSMKVSFIICIKMLVQYVIRIS